MADETRVIKIEIDNQSAIAQAEKQKLAILQLKQEQQGLNSALKAGDLTLEEYASETVRVEQLTKKHTQAYSELTHEIQGTKSFTDQLKESMSAGAGVMDKMTGGAYSAAQGIAGITKEALVFIATPLGAIIAAIGLAVGALTAYFKSSEEGQNRWNRIVITGKTLLEAFKNIIEAAGEAIYDMVTNPKQALEDFGNLLKDQVVNRFTGMVELIPKLGEAIGLLFEGKFSEAGQVAVDAVGKVALGVENITAKTIEMVKTVAEGTKQAMADAKRLADLQESIDKTERAMIVQRAKTELEVAKLREQALKQEGDVKRATIQQAIDLEKKLSDQEVALAQQRLEQAQVELKANGDDKEAKMKVAEATAAVINAEASRYQATLRFQKEIEKLNDEEIKKNEQKAAAIQKTNDDLRKKELEEIQKQNEEADRLAQEDFIRQKKMAEDEAKSKKTIDDTLHGALRGNLKATFDITKVNWTQGFDLFKKGAVKQLWADTNKAAVGAMSALSSIPFVGPVLGAAAYALMYAKGAASVASVMGLSLGFSEGGYTGPGSKYQPAGVVHAGEVVWSQADVAAVGGPYIANLMRPTAQYADGGIVTGEAVKQTNLNAQIMDMIRRMPPGVVSWREFTDMDRRIKTKESVARL